MAENKNVTNEGRGDSQRDSQQDKSSQQNYKPADQQKMQKQDNKTGDIYGKNKTGSGSR